MENIENEHPETPATQFQSRIDMTELRESLEKIKAEIGKVIVGQESRSRENHHSQAPCQDYLCGFQQDTVHARPYAFRYFGNICFQYENL